MCFFFLFLVVFCTSREYTESADTAVLFYFFGIEDRSDWGYYGVLAMPIGLHPNFIPHPPRPLVLPVSAKKSTGTPDKPKRGQMPNGRQQN